MSMSIEFSDVLASLALLLSVYATWKTFKFNKSQENLNKLLEEKAKDEALTKKKADLRASLVRLGPNKVRLKIYNQGEAPARDVRISFPEGNHHFFEHEIQQKFPMETLEKHQSVELFAAMGGRMKVTIKLIWADDFSEENSKLQYPTL